jgi:transposase
MPPKRHALTDRQWDRVRDLFERPQGRGGRWRDHREMLDAVLWVMKTGAQWRDLPGRFGPWQTAYSRFSRWRADGTLDRAVARLQRDLDREGLIRRSASPFWSAFCVDTTHVRASRAAAGARKRGAPPTERRALVSLRIMRGPAEDRPGARVAGLRPSLR